MQGQESLGTCADEGERKEESGRGTTVIDEVVLVERISPRLMRIRSEVVEAKPGLNAMVRACVVYRV